jgi:hypothetical protein
VCTVTRGSVLGGRYRVFLVEKYGSILEPEREHLTTCNIQMGEGGSATPCEQATHDVAASPVATIAQGGLLAGHPVPKQDRRKTKEIPRICGGAESLAA